jgi:tetratricopeptide (TPR) repeat protein
MRLKILGENHPDVQLVRTNLGRAYQEDRQFAAAESLYVEVLRARTAMFGAQNGAVASTTDDLGNLALARGDYLGAIRHYRAAILIWRTAKLPQFEALTQSSLGEALTRADSLDEAERLLSDALAKQRLATGQESNDVLRTANRLADAWRRHGGNRLKQADSLYRVIIALRRKTYGATSVQLTPFLESIARVREQLGDTASAEPFIREIVSNTSAVRPANDSGLVVRKAWLAATLCASGRVDEGERIAREVAATGRAIDPLALKRCERR